MAEERESGLAIVDGANVAHSSPSNGEPRLSNIVAMRKALIDEGYDPVVIVDATLRHSIDDPEQLEALLESEEIRQAPAGTDADYFVLKIADENDAVVISNDLFEDYEDQYPWIEERRIPFMIVRGQVHLYEPGPSSD